MITDELSSRIEQTISSISLEINKGDKTAGIVITLENEDGTTSEVTGTVEMTGMVTFNDLKGNGSCLVKEKLLFYRRHEENNCDFSRNTVPVMIENRLIFVNGLWRRLHPRKRLKNS